MQIVIEFKMQKSRKSWLYRPYVWPDFKSFHMARDGCALSERGWHNFYLNVGAHDRHTHTHSHTRVYINEYNKREKVSGWGKNKTIKATTLCCWKMMSTKLQRMQRVLGKMCRVLDCWIPYRKEFKIYKNIRSYKKKPLKRKYLWKLQFFFKSKGKN